MNMWDMVSMGELLSNKGYYVFSHYCLVASHFSLLFISVTPVLPMLLQCYQYTSSVTNVTAMLSV